MNSSYRVLSFRTRFYYRLRLHWSSGATLLSLCRRDHFRLLSSDYSSFRRGLRHNYLGRGRLSFLSCAWVLGSNARNSCWLGLNLCFHSNQRVLRSFRLGNCRYRSWQGNRRQSTSGLNSRQGNGSRRTFISEHCYCTGHRDCSQRRNSCRRFGLCVSSVLNDRRRSVCDLSSKRQDGWCNHSVCRSISREGRRFRAVGCEDRLVHRFSLGSDLGNSARAVSDHKCSCSRNCMRHTVHSESRRSREVRGQGRKDSNKRRLILRYGRSGLQYRFRASRTARSSLGLEISGVIQRRAGARTRGVGSSTCSTCSACSACNACSSRLR